VAALGALALPALQACNLLARPELLAQFLGPSEIRAPKVLMESPEIPAQLVYLGYIPSGRPESPALLDRLEIPQRLHS